jgi:hypothetical protein
MGSVGSFPNDLKVRVVVWDFANHENDSWMIIRDDDPNGRGCFVCCGHSLKVERAFSEGNTVLAGCS